MTSEHWKTVAEYTKYEVSDLGRVRRGGKMLSLFKTSWGGYLMVRLYSPPSFRDVLVHRLVLETFVGPGGAHEGNHKNLNRQDNALINLEWVTHSKNMEHAFKLHGPSVQGETVGTHKVTEKEVIEIRASYANGETQSSIAKRYGITQAGVSMITLRKNWKHVQ